MDMVIRQDIMAAIRLIMVEVTTLIIVAMGAAIVLTAVTAMETGVAIMVAVGMVGVGGINLKQQLRLKRHFNRSVITRRRKL